MSETFLPLWKLVAEWEGREMRYRNFGAAEKFETIKQFHLAKAEEIQLRRTQLAITLRALERK